MLAKEQIVKYLKTLENQEQELRAAIENHTTTLHAVSGAIQAIKHLLSLSEKNDDNKTEEKGDKHETT